MTAPRICVCISGQGTNLQALIDAIAKKRLDATISLVVSNRNNVGGIDRAISHSIPTLTKTLKSFKDDGRTRVEFDIELAQDIIAKMGIPDLIVLAGFMHILSPEFLNLFPKNTIINLHPALPTQFDGARAIERAFDSFKKREIKHTGVMIHRCIPKVDGGEVIIQEICPILDTDDLGDLEARIHLIEHKLIVQGVDLALFLAKTIR